MWEGILASATDEEMSLSALLGRIDVAASLAALTGALGGCAPWFATLWEGPGTGVDVSPDAAALLEEVRVLVLLTGHLLTDSCVVPSSDQM